MGEQIPWQACWREPWSASLASMVALWHACTTLLYFFIIIKEITTAITHTNLPSHYIHKA